MEATLEGTPHETPSQDEERMEVLSCPLWSIGYLLKPNQSARSDSNGIISNVSQMNASLVALGQLEIAAYYSANHNERPALGT